MKTVAKVAVSLPVKTLRELDAAGRRLGRSRSALVSQAVEEFLAAVEGPSEDDRRYAEAYLRHPENVAEIAVTAAGAISSWEPWK